MTVLITLTIPSGGDASDFRLYSNIDSYTNPFEVDITAAQLTAGYTTSLVPSGTTIIRVESKGLCTNHIDINVTLIPTPTTTTTSTSNTTTTTTTAAPTTTTTTSSTSTSTSSTTTTTTTVLYSYLVITSCIGSVTRYAIYDPTYPIGSYIHYLPISGIISDDCGQVVNIGGFANPSLANVTIDRLLDPILLCSDPGCAV